MIHGRHRSFAAALRIAAVPERVAMCAISQQNCIWVLACRPVEDTVYEVRQELGQHTPPEAMPDPADPKSEANLRAAAQANGSDDDDDR